MCAWQKRQCLIKSDSNKAQRVKVADANANGENARRNVSETKHKAESRVRERARDRGRVSRQCRVVTSRWVRRFTRCVSFICGKNNFSGSDLNQYFFCFAECMPRVARITLHVDLAVLRVCAV